MDHDKALELSDIMSEALPDEAVTLEVLFEAYAIMVAGAIGEALESQDEALTAFQYLVMRMGMHVAALELVGETKWSNKGRMN